MQTTAIETVANSLPENKVILLTPLISKRYIPYTDLQRIADCILLVSNPCFEFWFLLHYEDVRAELTSKSCIERLKKYSIQYSKGTLSDTERLTLSENKQLAVGRAQKLKEYKNPSSTVYRLIEELEKVK